MKKEPRVSAIGALIFRAQSLYRDGGTEADLDKLIAEAVAGGELTLIEATALVHTIIQNLRRPNDANRAIGRCAH